MPTCDYCGAAGYARYRHRSGAWIDTCRPHAPTVHVPAFAAGQRLYYHTRRHAAYPAAAPSDLQT